MFNIKEIKGRAPLIDYPWRKELDRLLAWLIKKDSHTHAFCFDLIMSASYIDATSGIEKSIEQCHSITAPYNAHLGFINLCSPCYTQNIWRYQKAVKPQSGALGKLSSEIILKFIEKLYPQLLEVIVVGGTEPIDAILRHKSGIILLAEVKSAPLLTYPFLFKMPKSTLKGEHKKIIVTNSQLRICESSLYLHNCGVIHLGKVGSDLWPFKPLIDFIINDKNMPFIQKCIDEWLLARTAYSTKDRQNKMYYLANACGNPPKIAKERDSWSKKESISDSKTSAGMCEHKDLLGLPLYIGAGKILEQLPSPIYREKAQPFEYFPTQL